MPIYEYKCRRCGKIFEILVYGRDRKTVHCPASCGGSVIRVMSSFSCLGVQLTKKFRMEAEERLQKERVK
jgi:putative FmdB family regulatory protein